MEAAFEWLFLLLLEKVLLSHCLLHLFRVLWLPFAEHHLTNNAFSLKGFVELPYEFDYLLSSALHKILES